MIILLFVLSASVLPLSFSLKKTAIIVKEVSPKEAEIILGNRPYLSVIGHPETAEFLSELLHLNLDVSRKSIELGPGDSALALQIRSRVSGKILSKQELNQMMVKGELRLLYFTVSP